MSTYSAPREFPRPRSTPNYWPFVLLLLVGAVAVWWFWLRPGGGPNPNAALREITPRGDLTEAEKSTIALYQKASRSVVHITTLALARNAFSLRAREVPQGTGTGIVWDEDGHVVTNYHVIAGVQQPQAIQVVLADQSSWRAERAWYYPDKDLAVLWIKVDRKSRLAPIDLGTSHDLQVGQHAFAIGNPFGLDQTLTRGIVSALDRELPIDPERPPLRGLIQTDAAINPGNSGGPLLDIYARLIGVNTAIRADAQGIGFAIPVDVVRQVVAQLIQRGEVRRAVLGVATFADGIARRHGIAEGVLINEVLRGGPAAQAGLRSTQLTAGGDMVYGDVIVAIDGKPVKKFGDLLGLLGRHKPGDIVTVTVVRDGERKEVQVTLEEGR